jgi:hypothetical protein
MKDFNRHRKLFINLDFKHERITKSIEYQTKSKISDNRQEHLMFTCGKFYSFIGKNSKKQKTYLLIL